MPIPEEARQFLTPTKEKRTTLIKFPKVFTVGGYQVQYATQKSIVEIDPIDATETVVQTFPPTMLWNQTKADLIAKYQGSIDAVDKKKQDSQTFKTQLESE